MFINNEECESLFEIAPWIPPYAEWANMRQLPSPVQLLLLQSMNFSTTSSLQYMNGHEDLSVVTFAPFAQKMDMSAILREKSISLSDWSREMLKRLYSQGSDFLYGMLFEHTLLLGENVLNGIPRGTKANPDAVTIALDASAHPQQDGAVPDISLEVDCIEQMLAEARSGDETLCAVYIMSNEQMRIERLQTWLTQRNCSTLISIQNATDSKDEDGESLQFFQGLILASKARTAFIGHRQSSSSDLLLSILEYQRRQEIKLMGRNPPLIPLLHKCMI